MRVNMGLVRNVVHAGAKRAIKNGVVGPKLKSWASSYRPPKTPPYISNMSMIRSKDGRFWGGCIVAMAVYNTALPLILTPKPGASTGLYYSVNAVCAAMGLGIMLGPEISLIRDQIGQLTSGVQEFLYQQLQEEVS
jgi:hypothetical protein